MNAKMQQYLEAAIRERAQTAYAHPERCGQAISKMVRVSIRMAESTRGQSGIGARTLWRALELATEGVEKCFEEV